MSIHANLSPEAQARLNAQQRNSRISSAIIAILSIVVIAMVLSIFLLPPIFQQSPTVKVIHDPGITDDPPIKPRPVANPLKRKPTPPAASAAQTRVIEAHTVSTVSIPVPDVAVMAPSADYGDGDDFGLGVSGDTFGGGLGSKAYLVTSASAVPPPTAWRASFPKAARPSAKTPW